MAETSIAWTVAKHLVETARDAPAATGALVEPGWPGEQFTKPDMLWIETIGDTTNEVVVMSGGRSHRDDKFTIRFLARVTGRKTLDEALTRIEELGALIENPIADSPTLNELDGLVSVDFERTTLECGRTPEGPVAFAAYAVACHTRLT